jgi:hypothetical protein
MLTKGILETKKLLLSSSLTFNLSGDKNNFKIKHNINKIIMSNHLTNQIQPKWNIIYVKFFNNFCNKNLIVDLVNNSIRQEEGISIK